MIFLCLAADSYSSDVLMLDVRVPCALNVVLPAWFSVCERRSVPRLDLLQCGVERSGLQAHITLTCQHTRSDAQGSVLHAVSGETGRVTPSFSVSHVFSVDLIRSFNKHPDASRVPLPHRTVAACGDNMCVVCL